MKETRRLMMQAVTGEDGQNPLPVRMSKQMVKAIALVSLFPVAQGVNLNLVENAGTMASHGYYGYAVNFVIIVVYTLAILYVGIRAGFYLNDNSWDEEVNQRKDQAMKELRKMKKGINKCLREQEEGEEEPMEVDYEARAPKAFDTVEEWGPENGCLREYRVLDQPEDAEPEEEYFRVIPGGAGGDQTIRFYRPNHHVRSSSGVNEVHAADLDDFHALFSEREEEIPRLRERPNHLIDLVIMEPDDYANLPIPNVGVDWSRAVVLTNHLYPHGNVQELYGSRRATSSMSGSSKNSYRCG